MSDIRERHVPRCDICGKNAATFTVPVYASSTRGERRRQTGTEHWCVPCYERVFPPGVETAWRHVTDGWVR